MSPSRSPSPWLPAPLPPPSGGVVGGLSRGLRPLPRGCSEGLRPLTEGCPCESTDCTSGSEGIDQLPPPDPAGHRRDLAHARGRPVLNGAGHHRLLSDSIPAPCRSEIRRSPAGRPPVEPAVVRRAPPSTAQLRRFPCAATRRRFPARPAAFLPPFSPACRWPSRQLQPRYSAFLSTPASPHSSPKRPSDSGESEAPSMVP